MIPKIPRAEPDYSPDICKKCGKNPDYCPGCNAWKSWVRSEWRTIVKKLKKVGY